MSDGRWVLLIASELGGTNSVSDRAMERLCNAIGEEGYEVVRTSTPEDGLSLVKSDPSHSAILLDWDLEEEHQFDERAALKIIRAVRRRNKKVPIFLIADRTLVSELPLEVVKQVHEYIHLFGDTPAFIANRVDFAVARYNEQLLPPYFRELKKYTDQGAYSWDAPGHMGGVAFLKHPVGMQFHRFFGENLLRADLGISTSSLGSWLDHIGPPAESERNAARIFGADWTFYVLSGSSTSNQIVGHGVIGNNDIVLVDANCHKSICHSLTVTGARPVYFKPTRNGYGMIGLVPLRRFSPEHIQQLIKDSPFSADASSQEPTLAVVTNSTYDGFCYDVQRVTSELARSVPRIQFDEAWYAYAKFHSHLSRTLRHGCAGRYAQPAAAVRRPVDAQDAGRLLHGIDDPRKAERPRAPGLRPVQRSLHDAWHNFTLLSHDCFARRGHVDDGRTGGSDPDVRDDSGCDQLQESHVFHRSSAALGQRGRMVLQNLPTGHGDRSHDRGELPL